MSKATPPSGYTGANALEIDEELALGEWLETAGNIALRLPDTLVGIDIDAYKDSGACFEELVSKLGPLPESMGLTSHADIADGGTLFFSIPKGMKFKGSHGTVDVIQSHHRYTVAAPSIHPSGRIYRWVSSSGQELPWIPEPDTFPDLPKTWIDFFQLDAPKPVVKEERVFVEPEPFEFEAGSACKKMNSMLKGAIIRLKEGKTGRHDAMVLTTWALTGEAAKGHTGYERVLEAYEKAWQKQFSPTEQEKRPLPLEFTSALRGAQRKIGMKEKECRCHLEAKVAPRQLKDLKMWR